MEYLLQGVGVRKPIIAREEVVINIPKAATALHIYLMHGRQFEPRNHYCLPTLVDHETPVGLRWGEWRYEAQEYEGSATLRKRLE